MTQDEAYKFCEDHQRDDDDLDIVINAYPNTNNDNGYELQVVCNGIYHYMNRDYFEELKEGLKLAEDDYEITINEHEI